VPNHSAFGKRNDSRVNSLKFEKRSQYFIRASDKALSVAAMCVSNPDYSSLRIHR
jgi:hypothetical protein